MRSSLIFTGVACVIQGWKGHKYPIMEGHSGLALPAFKEMHNHLDKTYLGLPWKSCTPVPNLMERLNLEAVELAELAETGQSIKGRWNLSYCSFIRC